MKLQESIDRQILMSNETWKALLAHGLKEDQEVRIDFFYYTKDKAAAEKLKALLEEYEYEVKIESRGSFFNMTYAVLGQTAPTTLTLEKLHQWIDWMVTAGHKNGCEFDGWGCAL